MSKEDKKIKSKDKDKKPSTLKNMDDLLLKFQRIPNAEKIFFVQHLSTMIKSGISLAKALDGLSRQTQNKRFKKVIKSIAESVERGQSLTDSLKPYDNIFNELFINMVRAGEVSGKLEDVLKQLYKQMKKEHKLRAKVRGALTYPAVIFVAMVGIGMGVMIFVVPKMIGIFDGVDMELPLMTRILISISDFITNNGIITVVSFVLIIFAIMKIIKTKKGKYYFNLGILKMPIISGIIKKINLARFARTMSSLLKTDIKIVESFEITANTLGNVHYKNSLKDAAEKVKKGQEINKLLSAYPKLYPSMVLQMISVGEETGELDNILDELASFYEGEVDEVMNTLPTIIEPLIILVLAAGIGSMAVAIIMPMYALTNAF